MFKIVGRKLEWSGRRDIAMVNRIAKELGITPQQAVIQALEAAVKREAPTAPKDYQRLESKEKKNVKPPKSS